MLTPSTPVSDDRGDSTMLGSLPGKLPGLLWATEIGVEIAWSDADECQLSSLEAHRLPEAKMALLPPSAPAPPVWLFSTSQPFRCNNAPRYLKITSSQTIQSTIKINKLSLCNIMKSNHNYTCLPSVPICRLWTPLSSSAALTIPRICSCSYLSTSLLMIYRSKHFSSSKKQLAKV